MGWKMDPEAPLPPEAMPNGLLLVGSVKMGDSVTQCCGETHPILVLNPAGLDSPEDSFAFAFKDLTHAVSILVGWRILLDHLYGETAVTAAIDQRRAQLKDQTGH